MNRSALLFLVLLVFSYVGYGQNNPPDTVNVQIGCQSVNIGETICIPVTLSDIDLFSFQFSFYYDPNLFDTGYITNIHPILQQDPLTFSDIDAQGGFRVLWFSQSLGDAFFSVDTPLFELCLVAAGPPGIYPINLQDFPTEIEFSKNGGTEEVVVVSEGCMLEIIGSGLFTSYCYNQASSEATVFLETFGGTAPYTVTWTGDATGSINFTQEGQQIDIPGFVTGTYYFEAVDNNGTVIGRDTLDITNASGEIILGIDAEPPICPGGDEGYIELAPPAGGVEPYSYAWSTGEIQVTSLYDLPDGNYSVTVTDAKGCSTSDSVTFSTPQFFLDTLQWSGPDCGETNGRLRVKAGGGTSSNQEFFDYIWVTPTNDTIENLSFGTGAPSTTNDLEAGNYQLTITDELGCEGTFNINLPEAKEIQIMMTNFRDITCFGANDGSITIAAVDSPPGSAAGNIILELVHPNGDTTGSVVVYNNLGPGDYTIIARDNECMSTLDFTLTDPPPFTIADSIIIDESCNAEDDGAIALTMAGGTAPYSFNWSNGGTDSLITNLDTGTYTVDVMDANGCSQQFAFDIEKAGVRFGFDTIQNIQCPGSADAVIDLIGVQQNYTFQWSTGSTDKSISNLGPGTYTVTVTDGVCSGVDSITLIDPVGINVSNITLTPPMCALGSDGNIDIEITGGTEPYQYEWSDGSTFRTLAQVPAGNYSVTISDANNCESITIDTALADPVAMLLTFTNIDSVSCFTPDVFGPDGGAEVLVTNGVPPYDFFWANGESGTTAALLAQGWNLVTAVDGDGCQITDSVFIPSPPEIILDTIQTMFTEPTCFSYNDGSVDVRAGGGVPGYTYLWPNPDGSPGTIGPFKDNLTAGSYRVLVRDSKGCRDSLFVTLGQPLPITASIDTINTRSETCHDSNDGRIALNTTGRDSSDLIFTWTDNVSFNNLAENLDTGLYQIIIEDELGCPGDTLTYFLDGPAPITYFFSGDQEIDCNGETILLNFNGITGGNVPTDYSISFNGGPAQSNNNLIEVAAGQYDLTITDKLGCTIDTSILITEPPAIVIDFGNIDPLSLGDSVLLNVLVTGGNGVFVDYVWDQLDNLNCLDPNCLELIASPVSSTSYLLTVTDSSGCMQEAILNIEVNQNRFVFIPNAFSPNGDGVNDIFRLFTGPGVTNIRQFQIYDRWGDMIFTRDNVTPSFGGTDGWNGEYGDSMMNPGVYVYFAEVEFIDGTVLIYRGDVTLIR